MKVGEVWTAKVTGKLTTVRIEAIRAVDGEIVYEVKHHATGAVTLWRSKRRFLARVEQPSNELQIGTTGRTWVGVDAELREVDCAIVNIDDRKVVLAYIDGKGYLRYQTAPKHAAVAGYGDFDNAEVSRVMGEDKPLDDSELRWLQILENVRELKHKVE